MKNYRGTDFHVGTGSRVSPVKRSIFKFNFIRPEQNNIIVIISRGEEFDVRIMICKQETEYSVLKIF